jgi:TolA-binding protein
MEIDVNTVIQKLVNQIADLQLQVAILQTEKESLQRQLSEKQEENQSKNA